MELLPALEVETRAPATHAVVWLHGLGADGHDFEPAVRFLGLPADAHVRFVFPHAPVMPVTLNGGMRMRAWYDILDFDIERRADLPGLRRSAALVEARIAREVERGIPASRIVLAGFSQGGAVALHVGLCHPEPLAGVVALSTYLPGGGADLDAEASAAGRRNVYFQGHGTDDPVVPFAAGMQARDRLTSLGCPLEWHAYPIAHEVNAAELSDVGRFLAARRDKTRT